MIYAVDWPRAKKIGSPLHKLVFYAISFYLNLETKRCEINYSDLVEDTELPIQEVEQKIHDLAKAGFIKLHRCKSLLEVEICGYAEWIAEIPKCHAKAKEALHERA